MPIIGTAGHVDHGKSTLVRALTGIDPDRLAEEKRRGMTIDLGFANLTLPSGQRAGVVDVPGHARFLHNMLAGVHGMDAVLLVVAADEGVRQQTREHLDILQLLDVTRIVVALAKSDLVDPAFLPLVSAEVTAELMGRGLEARVIPVSAPRGVGLEDLRVALADLLAGVSPPDRQRPRLPVDRAFTMTGFGTVVTGSLVDGALVAGQELELLPSDGRAQRVRVRGLEQYGEQVASVPPGSRVAANLVGLGADEIRRGQVLAPTGTLPTTARMDVRLRALPQAVPRHGERVAVHTGTAEVAARLVLLDGGTIEPGGEGWAQLRLERPLAARDGDLFVIRRLSPAETIAGGAIIDATARARRRGEASSSVEARQEHQGRLLGELAKSRSGVERSELAALLSLPEAEVEALLEGVVGDGRAVDAGGRLFAATEWARLERQAREAVAKFQTANRLHAGMPLEALRSAIRLDGRVRDAVDVMIARGGLERAGADLVRTPGHQPQPTAAERSAIQAVLTALGAAPLSPPGMAELRALGLTEDLARYLDERQLVVRVAPDALMLPQAVADAERRVREHLNVSDTMSVADARDLLGSSRRIVVPLLEYFDARHVTRREGDVRRLRG